MSQKRIELVVLAALAVTLVLGCATSGPAIAKHPAKSSRAVTPGIMLMAHGGDEAWNEAIKQTVKPLAKEHPVEIAFGMADRATMKEALHRLGDQGVTQVAVVRMFVSRDSFIAETESILGLRPPLEHPATHEHESHADSHGGHHMSAPDPIPLTARVLLSREGVAESPLVDEILLDRAKKLSREPKRERVLILAHGPGDDAENERWLDDMRRRTQPLREVGFQDVRCETLREDWPERREQSEKRIREYVEDARTNGEQVIVIPFRVAGFGPYADVLSGLDYLSDGLGFCPHPNMTRWIKETAEECFESSNDQSTTPLASIAGRQGRSGDVK
ncbi:MAG: hypothetical protein HY706_13535 [Candidatus Hydrogenedentes bacterium]|nr:hypothetical protein [Candidatus Hydrogenedentota bacterium]